VHLLLLHHLPPLAASHPACLTAQLPVQPTSWPANQLIPPSPLHIPPPTGKHTEFLLYAADHGKGLEGLEGSDESEEEAGGEAVSATRGVRGWCGLRHARPGL
jgi:hypothetical protein